MTEVPNFLKGVVERAAPFAASVSLLFSPACTPTELPTPVPVNTPSPDNLSPHGVDDEPPKIELNGSLLITLCVGDRYVDPGVTAEDDKDGNITYKVLTDLSQLKKDDNNENNPYAMGIHTIVYSVTDTGGNPFYITRMVVVVDCENSSQGRIK